MRTVICVLSKNILQLNLRIIKKYTTIKLAYYQRKYGNQTCVLSKNMLFLIKMIDKNLGEWYV